MKFYQSVLLEKNFLENIGKKFGFWGNYPFIFTLSGQTYDSKTVFKNLHSICHKSVELQNKSKTF